MHYSGNSNAVVMPYLITEACGQCHNDYGSSGCVDEQFLVVKFKQECGAHERVDYDRKSYLIFQTVLIWHTTPLLSYKVKWWQAQLKISLRLGGRHRVETNEWLQSSVSVTKQKTRDVTQTLPELCPTQIKYVSVRKPWSNPTSVLKGISTRFESVF